MWSETGTTTLEIVHFYLKYNIIDQDIEVKILLGVNPPCSEVRVI